MTEPRPIRFCSSEDECARGGVGVTEYEAQLLRTEQRAENKTRLAQIRADVAKDRGSDAAAARYGRAAARYDRIRRKAWLARVEAGTRRWAGKPLLTVVK